MCKNRPLDVQLSAYSPVIVMESRWTQILTFRVCEYIDLCDLALRTNKPSVLSCHRHLRPAFVRR